MKVKEGPQKVAIVKIFGDSTIDYAGLYFSTKKHTMSNWNSMEQLDGVVDFMSIPDIEDAMYVLKYWELPPHRKARKANSEVLDSKETHDEE